MIIIIINFIILGLSKSGMIRIDDLPQPTKRIQLTVDIIFSTVRRLDCGASTIDTTEHDVHIIRQILEDQVKAEKWDELKTPHGGISAPISDKSIYFEDVIDTLERETKEILKSKK